MRGVKSVSYWVYKNDRSYVRIMKIDLLFEIDVE